VCRVRGDARDSDGVAMSAGFCSYCGLNVPGRPDGFVCKTCRAALLDAKKVRARDSVDAKLPRTEPPLLVMVDAKDAPVLGSGILGQPHRRADAKDFEFTDKMRAHIEAARRIEAAENRRKLEDLMRKVYGPKPKSGGL
jgi:hypothetical protein